MENVKRGSSNVAFKWAAISLVATIILTYIWEFLKVDPNSPIRYLGFIPFIAFLFLAQKEYRDQLGGFATFGEEFVAGLLFSVFSGILGAIFIYIYYSWLSPAAYQLYLDAQKSAMEARNSSPDQVEQGMAFMNKFGIWIVVAGMLIGTPIIGAIISLIGAAIFKKGKSILDIEKNSDSYIDPAV